ncbi:MAG: hypothetical protein AAGA57_04805 [Planctomycetota bacterium]
MSPTESGLHPLDPSPPYGVDATRSPAQAVALAWVSWGVMVLTPAIWGLALALRSGFVGAPAEESWMGWGAGVVAAAWLAIAVPLVLVLRGYVLRASWSGKPVDPDSYLRGLIGVWVTLEAGAVVALIGATVSGSAWPALLPAMLAVLALGAIRPDASAVANPPPIGFDSPMPAR